MQQLRAWATVGIVLLMLEGACSKGDQSQELAALEKAYQAGVLSKDEYADKKAALESMARQPEVKDDLRGSLILGAALIEGVALLGAVICLLVVLK